MAIGELTEIINACEVHLVSSDTWLLLQDLDIHVSRPEFRDPSTGGGAVYSYGKGEHHMTFTLIATTPELTTISAMNNIDGNGKLTPTTWTVTATDVSGNITKTFTCTGILVSADFRKGSEGKLFVDCFVRITPDTVAVS